jgi:hypothetical protein
MPTEPSGNTDVIRYAKMPNKIIAAHHRPNGEFLLWHSGCDGQVCWSGENSHSHVEDQKLGIPTRTSTYEQSAYSFHNNYYYGYMPLDLARLKKDFSRIEVRNRQHIRIAVGPERNERREAYLVVGHLKPPGDAIEYLFFDVETGYLLRRIRGGGGPDPFGPSLQQLDFWDYRDVGDGTKAPFLHIDQHFDEKSRESVTLIQDNVPIDDAVVARPKTSRQPPMSALRQSGSTP